MPGALYAADCKAERDEEAELYLRGYYITLDGIASPSRHEQICKHSGLYGCRDGNLKKNHALQAR